MKLDYVFFADTNNKNKEAFNDAIPIGNGRIGAMIYGNPYTEKLVLNNDSVWLGKKNRKRWAGNYYDVNKQIKDLIINKHIKEAEELAKYLFSAPKGECIYTTSGELLLHYKDIKTISNYKRSLDLDNGILNVSYLINENNEFNATYLASNPDDLIYINIKTSKPLSFSLNLDRNKLVDEIKCINNTIVLKYEYSKNMYLYIKLIVNTDGKLSNISDNLIIKEALNTNIYLSLATSYYYKRPLAYLNRLFSKLNYNDIVKKHIADYQSLYARQYLKTNDSFIDTLYNFSRYLMISGSRKNSLPLNLQGIWNQDIFPAWDSKYTININLQMNYFNVFGANLIECSLPYFKLLKLIHKNGRRLAKKMYHSNGFVAFHNSDIYGDVAPQDKYLPATLWPFGGAWLSLKIFEYYEYTKDLKFLNKYFYIILDAVIFFKENLVYIDNEYKMIPSLSPENSYILNGDVLHLCSGATMDSEILYDLFSTYLKAIAILNIKDKYDISNILNHLPKLKIGKYGQIVEWNEDYEENEPGHRHISQLYALYPSNQINYENKELMEAASKTIERRLANGGGHTGWSAAWLMNMAARLRDTNLFIELLNKFKNNSLSKTNLDLHPPFQIDGNFGVGSAIYEMLIYNGKDYIELLPLKYLSDGEFFGVKVKGDFTISFKFKNYLVTYLKIKGRPNSKLKIKANYKINVPLEIALNKNGVIEFK